MRKAYKADGSPVLYIATAQSMYNNKPVSYTHLTLPTN